MAQKRIEYYGKFTPTGVDDYSDRRVRALAGLAEQVGDLALGFAEKKKKERQAVQEQIDTEQSIRDGLVAGAGFAATGDRPELRVYDEYSTLQQDVEFNRNVLAGYEAGAKNSLRTKIEQFAKENPTDYAEFETLSKGAFEGVYSATPEFLRPGIQSYYDQMLKTNGSPIAKAERKALADQASAETNTLIESESVNILNLARMQDSEGVRVAYQNRLDLAARDPNLSKEQFAEETLKLNDQIVEQYAIGKIDRALTENENLTPIQTIEEARNIISSIKESDVYSIENPIDPDTSITLDPEERDALIDKLEQRVDDYEKAEIQKAEQAFEVNKITQAQNYTDAMSMAQDPSISNEQKIVSINEAEMLGQIGDRPASLLRAYVNSVDKLKATSNSQKFGDIISRVYDLNAQLEFDPSGAPYLTGIANLKEEVIQARISGDLTQEDETKILKQMDNLTLAKIAGATTEIASTWTQASRIIKTSLPPDLNGVAVRLLFERVELEKQSLEEQGQTITRTIERNLWTKYASEVVNEVQNTRRSEVMTQVREVLSKPEELNREESQDKTVGRFQVKVVE
jgi:hypothetical protein